MNTKGLAELQRALQDFLLDKTQDAANLTLETPGFSRAERLTIYYDAYRLRLIDALRNDYPALEMYLGEDDFATMTTEFIAANPSHHPSLRWLGGKLAEFLSAHPHWREHTQITELASFEWAQVMAFDAADSLVSTLDDVRALQPEQWMTMHIEFHPSVQHLSFFSNAPDLWSSLLKDDTAFTVEKSETAKDWLVWRKDLQVVFRPLDKTETWALKNFLQHKKFADICSGLCEWFPEEQVPLQAATYLQRWILDGLVTQIHA